MYAIFKTAQKFIISFVIIFTLLTIIHPVVVYARTAAEIEQEKIEKQKELDALNADLKNAEQALKLNISRKSSSLSEIDRIKAELAEIESQLEVNKLTQAQLEQEIGIKSLEKEDTERMQNIQIATSYISWKTQDDTSLVLGGDDVLKNAIYYDYVTEVSKNSIKGLTSELETLTKSNEEYKAQIDKLAKDNTELSARKTSLEKQISQIDSNIAKAKTNVDGLRSKVVGVQQNLELLSNEQQEIINKENKILLQDNAQCVRNDLVAGQFYFITRGRDLYQGHGIGLSQFGALGAAQQGWNANKILTFYYTGTAVQTLAPRNVNVTGYGSMDINTYVAGLGEIPSKACGSAEQASQNPSKYVADNPATIWDCWPEEAIKAQVIAARSYAATSSQPICTSAACQVYVGGNNKQWAADETANQYVTHGGNIIRAFYSSDNSQGYGTASISEVWNNWDGSYSGNYPYLQAVNDMGIAANGGYRDWTCRTNSYNIEQINQFFDYAKNDYTSAKSFLTNLKNTVGTVTSLSFEKGPSQRVKVVRVNGTNGTATMSGSLFKSVWNDWIYNKKPSGQFDYLYSLTWTYQNS
jgi:SpoIID/LytB domain protein